MSKTEPRLSSMAAGLDNVRRYQRAEARIKVILEQTLEGLERVLEAERDVAHLALTGRREG